MFSHGRGTSYMWPDKDNELSCNYVDQIELLPERQSPTFGSCGKDSSTKGKLSFKFYDRVVVRVEWDCSALPGS